MKKLYIYILVSSMPLILNAGTDVDFDGRRKEAKNTAMQRNDSANNSARAPAKDVIISSSAESPRLRMELRTRSDSGEWIPVQSARKDNSYTSEGPSDLYVKLEILTKTGEMVEVKPKGGGMGASKMNFNQYSVYPGTKGRWTVSCARREWERKVDYFSDPSYGGHGHDDTPVPPVLISSISLSASTAPFHAAPSPIVFPNLQGNTTYYYWEQFPAFSTMFFEYPLGCGGSATNYIYVEVAGLIELPGGNYYYDFNPWESNAYHRQNHYGTQKLIDTMKTIADTYVAAFPAADKLYVYDVSLLRGGVIDVNRDWSRPFYGHDTGIDADISKKMVPEENRRKLLEIMCANAPTYSEQDVPGEASYFHIRVLNDATGAPTEDFRGDRRTTLNCCKGNAINPDTLETCISTRTLAH